MVTVWVSGPDLDRAAESAAIGVSVALTFASRRAHARTSEEVSYYVRDGDRVVGRVDALADGTVHVYDRRTLDRASRSADALSGPGGRAPRRSAGTVSAASSGKEKKMAKEKSMEGALAGEVARVTAKQATVRVLRRADGPLHADEIARRVLATRGVHLAGATPAATIKAMLSVENKKPDGLFRRVEKGTYELRDAKKSAGKAADPAGATA